MGKSKKEPKFKNNVIPGLLPRGWAMLLFGNMSSADKREIVAGIKEATRGRLKREMDDWPPESDVPIRGPITDDLVRKLYFRARDALTWPPAGKPIPPFPLACIRVLRWCIAIEESPTWDELAAQTLYVFLLEFEAAYQIQMNSRWLALGPRAAAANRTTKAQQKRAVMEQAVNDLFRQGEGWKMTNEQIANFLCDRNLSTYEPETTIKYVKPIVANIKRKSQ